MAGRPAGVQRVATTAKLAVLLGILTPLFVTGSRLTPDVADRPGRGLIAVLLIAVVLSAMGLTLAVYARMFQRNGVVTAGLWLNAVWLAAHLGMIAMHAPIFTG